MKGLLELKEITRKAMLQNLWREASFKKPTHTFSDGSIAVFVPSLKLENLNGDIELYDTQSEMYKIVPSYQLHYAFVNGLDAISQSVCYENCLRKQTAKNATERKEQYETISKRIDEFVKLKTLTITQIKNHYEQLQTTDSGSDQLPRSILLS